MSEAAPEPVLAAPAEPTLGERWIGFLRGYGPITRIDGMYAETLPSHARRYGFEPLQFEHPHLTTLLDALSPETGALTNVVLTGTAGDGKTTLCHELWRAFKGGDHRSTGKNRDNYLPLSVETPAGPRTLHFIFEFSGWCPEKGQDWPVDKLDLMNRFAASVQSDSPDEFFIIAANDGRLVQAWDSLPAEAPAKGLAPTIEELLATDQQSLPDLTLLFLNLSRMSTSEILRRALACLLARDEWRCLVDEAPDPAFGPDSPLSRNLRLLQDATIRDRLIALADLLDANGLHISIREVLLLLVNGLLGWASANAQVATVEDLRSIAAKGLAHEAALYRNLFGANLSERRRENLTVFRHLGGFRIGHETTNLLDSLLIFGADDPNLQADHAAHLASDPYYADNPEFERLRRAYLEAEDDRADGSHDFLEALVQERRRLFFRLPEGDDRLDPWRLTIFPSAGAYRAQVLAPLRGDRSADPIILQRLVCGLNRIWTGMLAGELDRLYLSTGLDLSSAKISDIFLYEVPLRRGLHGDEVSVLLDRERFPALRVTLGRDGHKADFRLHLVRYEFLTRVAQGALPSSFSKECNEDVLAFKSLVLSQFYKVLGPADAGGRPVSVLSPGPHGTFNTRQLSLTL